MQHRAIAVHLRRKICQRPPVRRPIQEHGQQAVTCKNFFYPGAVALAYEQVRLHIRLFGAAVAYKRNLAAVASPGNVAVITEIAVLVFGILCDLKNILAGLVHRKDVPISANVSN